MLATGAQVVRNYLVLRGLGVDISVLDSIALLIGTAAVGLLPIGPTTGVATAVLILGSSGEAVVAAAGALLTATGAVGALVFAGWALLDRLRPSQRSERAERERTGRRRPIPRAGARSAAAADGRQHRVAVDADRTERVVRRPRSDETITEKTPDAGLTRQPIGQMVHGGHRSRKDRIVLALTTDAAEAIEALVRGPGAPPRSVLRITLGKRPDTLPARRDRGRDRCRAGARRRPDRRRPDRRRADRLRGDRRQGARRAAARPRARASSSASTSGPRSSPARASSATSARPRWRRSSRRRAPPAPGWAQPPAVAGVST